MIKVQNELAIAQVDSGILANLGATKTSTGNSVWRVFFCDEAIAWPAGGLLRKKMLAMTLGRVVTCEAES